MVILKTPEEIEVMAEAGRRLAQILATLQGEVQPGIPTAYFDRRARELLREAGAKPAFLGYRPQGAQRAFPAAICVSVNDEVVHGIPSAYVIKEGDVVKLDFGLILHRFYVDAAVTVGAGKISPETAHLIAVTQEALEKGIGAASPGKTIGDIGWAIQSSVRAKKFSVADALTGHGIGRALHEDPWVPNIGRPGEGDVLQPGMVLAIEPMVNAGASAVVERPDEVFVTKDGSRSAHFEDTVAITENGVRVLTKR